MTTPELTAISRPERTCIGCRRRLAQASMVRAADGPQGPGLGRHLPGRGAWLCSRECFETAVRRRAFDRAFRRPLAGEAVEALRNAFEGVITDVDEVKG